MGRLPLLLPLPPRLLPPLPEVVTSPGFCAGVVITSCVICCCTMVKGEGAAKPGKPARVWGGQDKPFNA